MTTESRIKVLLYGALPPTKQITSNHLHQVLGFGNHSEDLILRTTDELTELKKDVREWAGELLKSKMAEIARSMGNKDNTIKIHFHDNDIRSFAELKLWWSNPTNQKSMTARNSIYYCLYGYFEECPGWEEDQEEMYMKKFKIQYKNESKTSVQEQCRHNGYKKKGCIAIKIAMVKHELVKQAQKAGRLYEEGMTFTKNRPRHKEL